MAPSAVIVLLMLICVTTMHVSDALFAGSNRRAFAMKKMQQNTQENKQIEYANDDDEEEEAPRRLLPQVVPHPDTSYLLEFVTEDNESCDFMRPLVKRLEKSINTKVRRLNIGARADLAALFEMVGGNECGNVPFYFNRRTAQAVCGPTVYNNLLRFATSNPDHLFIEAPIAGTEQRDYDPMNQREIGFMDKLSEKFAKAALKQKKSKKSRETASTESSS